MWRDILQSSWLVVLCVPLLGAEISPACAQGPRPSDVLRNRGIIRLKGSPSRWVLEDEAIILRRFRAVRGSAAQLQAARNVQQELDMGRQNPDQLINFYRMQIDLLDERISAMDQQIANLGPTVGNVNVVNWHNMLAQERNAMVMEQDRLRTVINSLGAQRDQFREQRRRFDDDAERMQGSYKKAAAELRDLVDTVVRRYETLGKNEEIAQALAELSRSSKTPQKFGPSRDLQGAIRWLESSEKPTPRRSPRTTLRKGRRP